MRIKEVDFIRGIAIVSVLLMHTIPSSVQSIIQWQIHIGQAVPLFILITLFLSFQGLKKNNGKCVGTYYSKKHIIRVFANVVCPALIVGSIQMIIDAASGGSAWRESGLLAWGGGVGPGSYYLWVYLQIWILIPLLFILLDRMKLVGVLILLLICFAINYFLCKIGVNAALYRLTCFRYLFLAVPAYMLLDVKRFSKTVICGLGIVSLVYLTVLYKTDFSPVTLDYGWAVHQWPAYFWTLIVYILLVYVANWISDKRKLYDIFCWLGMNSWYVFLAQMFILHYLSLESFRILNNSYVRMIVFIVTVFVLSILSAYIVYVFKQRFSNILARGGRQTNSSK